MPRLKSLLDAGRPAAPWKERERRGQREGVRHLVVSPLGDSYTGEWHADRRHGRGTQVWAQQGLVYDGEWRNGRRCGFGTLSVRGAGPSWEGAGPGGKGAELESCGVGPVGAEAGLAAKGAVPVGKGAGPWRRIYSGEWKDGKRHRDRYR
ncbi:MORN repeat-containing protein 3 [Petromyzon marinus]|uniref:MORN repeat-containing protein 3 n=1 Tax=Petromyzon marinus TaxID=7757 RepID=UPI003F727358